jgi:hypothetical protein
MRNPLVPESLNLEVRNPHHHSKNSGSSLFLLSCFLIKFESGNEEPILPEKKCFLRSCFESLAVASHPLQPNLISSEPNVSRDESGDGIGQVRFLGSAEKRCASS